jgi:heme/copper-type cytochrome/quinol oxidase subunit 2
MHTRFGPILNSVPQQTVTISNLFLLVLIVCGVILLIAILMLAVSLIRFRHRRDPRKPTAYFGNLRLEIIWTLAPILILICLFVLTAREMRQPDPTSIERPDIIVTGH